MHTHTPRCGRFRQSNCLSPLPVISGMSVRQVGADTVDVQCAVLAHIFYSECFLALSATLTRPPTPSNQYIISSHYAHMHIYKERVDNREERLAKRVCVAVLGRVGALLSREVSWLLIKEIEHFLCVRFSCSCTRVGMPQPRIEWFKDSVPLSKLANPRYKVTAATGLTVRRVQPGDGGIFQCLARNAAGETQAYSQLLVSSEFV